MTPEAKLARYLKSECKRLGIRAVKIASVGTRGCPDWLLIGPGRRVGFVELKSPEGRLSKAQTDFLNTLWEAGLYAKVSRSNDDITAALIRYLTKPGSSIR